MTDLSCTCWSTDGGRDVNCLFHGNRNAWNVRPVRSAQLELLKLKLETAKGTAAEPDVWNKCECWNDQPCPMHDGDPDDCGCDDRACVGDHHVIEMERIPTCTVCNQPVDWDDDAAEWVHVR